MIIYAERDHPIDELGAICSINSYGRTKYCIEELVRDWSHIDAERSAKILRYFNSVGAHKSGWLG